MEDTRDSCKSEIYTNTYMTHISGVDQASTAKLMGSYSYCVGYRGPRTKGYVVHPVSIYNGVGFSTPGKCVVTHPAYPRYRQTLAGAFACDSYYTNILIGDADSNLQIATRNKAFAKLQSSDFGTGVFLGELGETINLLRYPFRELAALLNSRNWKQAAKGSSSAWLQVRYGFMPIYNDIMSLYELLLKKAASQHLKMLRRRSKLLAPPKVTMNNRSHGGLGFNWTRVQRDTISVKSVSTIHYTTSMNAWLQTLGVWGLSPYQIPEVAWELVSLSFVVDWIVRVGDWISAITPNPQLQIKGCQTSQVITAERQVTASNPNMTLWKTLEAKPSTFTWTGSLLKRMIDPSQPAYMPAFNPSLLSFNQKMDSLALTVQKLLQASRK